MDFKFEPKFLYSVLFMQGKLLLLVREMAGRVASSQSTDAFEYMLLEGDPDHLSTVFSTPNRISPWIDPTMLKLNHRIGRGPFGDVWIATHHHRTEDESRFYEVAVKMLYPIKDDQLQVFSARFDEIFCKCQGVESVCFLHGISIQNGRVSFLVQFGILCISISPQSYFICVRVFL